MREILSRMLKLDREGRRFVVATVVSTHGSTPQVVGARLVVDDSGTLTGTLGGGCVEGDAIAEARRRLVEGGASLREYQLTEPLAWDTGLVCGGTMWIYIEPDRDALAPEFSARLASAMSEGSTRPIAFATKLRVAGRTVSAEGHCLIESGGADELLGEPLSASARVIVTDAFDRGVPRVVPIAEGREVLVEPIVGRP